MASAEAVFKFRERVRLSGLMDRLLEHTVRVAREQGGYSAKRVRALIDSSPLTGAGRVEDTFNLIGRCIAMLVEEASEHAGQSVEGIAAQLDLSVVSGSSVKAALDRDWTKPEARNLAIRELLAQLHRVRQWLQDQLSEEALATPPIADTLALVDRVVDQDTEPDPDAPGPDNDGPPAEDCLTTTRMHHRRQLERIITTARPTSATCPRSGGGRWSQTPK